MFKTQFFLPSDTLYSELEIEPTASTAEVQSALRKQGEKLRQELNTLRKQLDIIYEKIPQLKAVYDECERLEPKVDTDEKAKAELAKLQRQLPDIEEQAIALDPDFRQKRSRTLEIETKEKDLNKHPFNRSVDRQKYDRNTSLFMLLHIAPCPYNVLSDNKVLLSNLREDITQFVRDKDEVVFYPSDLQRTDFTTEFSYISQLDD